MEVGLLVLRVVVGALFFGHGAQKLFGWFGGHGPAGTGQFFESALGFRPGRRFALVAGFNEAVGGLLLALGLLTPLAAVLIVATMVVAVVTVHWTKGVWNADGGYELNVVYVATVVAVTAIGAGEWSLDAALALDVAGAGWALGALAAGLAGGGLAVVSGRGRPERVDGPQAAAA